MLRDPVVMRTLDVAGDVVLNFRRAAMLKAMPGHIRESIRSRIAFPIDVSNHEIHFLNEGENMHPTVSEIARN